MVNNPMRLLATRLRRAAYPALAALRGEHSVVLIHRHSVLAQHLLRPVLDRIVICATPSQICFAVSVVPNLVRGLAILYRLRAREVFALFARQAGTTP